MHFKKKLQTRLLCVEHRHEKKSLTSCTDVVSRAHDRDAISHRLASVGNPSRIVSARLMPYVALASPTEYFCLFHGVSECFIAHFSHDTEDRSRVTLKMQGDESHECLNTFFKKIDREVGLRLLRDRALGFRLATRPSECPGGASLPLDLYA